MTTTKQPIPNASILAASKSDLLWELSIADVMARFGLRHGQVLAARKLSMLTRKPRDIVNAQDRRDTSRLRNKVIRSEVAYPGILSMLQSTTVADVGSRYGFSRSRAHIILITLRDLAAAIGKTVPATVAGVVADARSRSKSPGG